MRFHRMKILTALFLTLSLSLMTLGHPTQSATTPEPRQQQNPERSLQAKIFTVKHHEPEDLLRVITPLGSGRGNATMQFSRELRTITVRDYPENIAAIEEALKVLDVPQAMATPRQSIEFHVHILVASNEAAPSSTPPDELKDVIKQLQATLNYKNYSVMTSSFHRTKEGNQGVSNNGVAESKLFNVNTPNGNPIFFNYALSPITVTTNAASGATVQVGMLSFGMKVPLNVGTATHVSINYENIGFRTPLSLGVGEKVIAGTTAMGDKGVVLVLTAKILK